MTKKWFSPWPPMNDVTTYHRHPRVLEPRFFSPTTGREGRKQQQSMHHPFLPGALLFSVSLSSHGPPAVPARSWSAPTGVEEETG